MPTAKEDRRIHFTKATITELDTPAKGRIFYHDEKTNGLSVCVSESGSKTFYLYKKFQGKPIQMKLGGFPELTVENARKKAMKALAEMADGKNPLEERKAARQAAKGEMNLRELFDWWLKHHAKPHKKANSVAEDERLFKRYLEPWEKRKISTIKRSDVRTLHAMIGSKNGKYAANRMLSLLSTIYAKAIHADDVAFELANPASGVDRFEEKSRDRFMEANEIPKFFESLEEESTIMRDFFKILLLTGARRSNVLAMRWEQVNQETAIWRIPETKSGDAVAVHLPTDAMRILQERRQAIEAKAQEKDEEPSEWVFPATRSDAREGHLNYPANAWKRICKRAGLKDLRIHDLRRTLGSWQAATGASLPIIGKTLGHRQQSTTQIYARLNLDPVRQSVDIATAAMMALAKAKDDASKTEQA